MTNPEVAHAAADLAGPRRQLPRFIRAIAGRLLCCGAQEVLLFGSYAKGQQNRDSDVDFLVIYSKPVSQRVQHELRDLGGSWAINIDIHALGYEEALAAKAEPTSFLGSCLASSVCLVLRPGVTSVLAPTTSEKRSDPLDSPPLKG
jgi:predicted nucleotidyltransferase